MEIVKTMNEVTALYEKGVIESGTEFKCPVCDKVYKTRKAAENHVNKMDCYKMQDVFAGTAYEEHAHALFISAITATNPLARTGLNVFRKSKMYGSFIRYAIFCAFHQVEDRGLYYSYLNEIVGFRYINKILKEGTEESRLRDYRVWLQRNPKFIDSDRFYERFSEHLKTDQQFLTRSIEKSHVSIDYLCRNRDFPFDAIMDKLDADYYMRIVEIVNQV